MNQPLRPMDVGQIIHTSFQLFFENIGQLILWSFVFLGTPLLLSVLLNNPLTTFDPEMIVYNQNYLYDQVFQSGTSLLLTLGLSLLEILGSTLLSLFILFWTYETFLKKPFEELSPLENLSRSWLRGLGISLLFILLIYGLLIALSLVFIVALVLDNTALMILGGLIALGGLGYLLFVFMPTYAFVLPCALLEKLSFSQAMKRSKELTQGMRGQILGVIILITLIAASIGGFAGFILGILSLSQGNFMFFGLITQFALPALIAPLSSLAFYLLYFSSRLKKEDLLLEVEVQGFQETSQTDPLEY